MSSSFFYACGMLAAASPFLASIGIVVFHFVRSVLMRDRRSGKRTLGRWSATVVLGTAFQFLQVLYRPSMSHVVEAQHDDRADDEDSGDPDSPANQLNRQLKKIRRGEQIDTIVLRLDDRWSREKDSDSR